MISELIQTGAWLPYSFALLLGLALLLYAILDGYDLGVGILTPLATQPERDRMIASIGPFWDANETWLVLAVGLLLVAFPAAHGEVLTTLYLPVSLMILALIFRGVSFDFRKKAPPQRQPFWNRAFFGGSLVVALTQGYMLGRFVTGFQRGAAAELFAISFGLLVVAGYALMGSTWIILKADGDLQRKAIRWARVVIWVMVLGAILNSLAAVFTDTRIYARMFVFPELMLLIVMPLAAVALTLLMHMICGVLPLERDQLAGLPFAIAIAIFVFGFTGLVYSFYPYIIPGRLKIVEAAAAPASLRIILVGTLFVFPFLIGYTALSYRIFRGKATDLSYD